MELLPRGANFVRTKMLWEIGLHIAGNPGIPYGGDRDMCIAVGSGGQAEFRPSLRLATGSAIMALDVAAGNIDMAFVNPSALLTQACRGVGLFEAPLPLRIVASYPSWDRFVIVVHERAGLRTLRDLKESRYPLKLSVREDPTHSTLVLIEQIFRSEGFSLAAFEEWGGELVTTGSPLDEARRMRPIREGTLDGVADEALIVWLDEALGSGYVPLELSDQCFEAVGRLGWRRVTLPASVYANLAGDHPCIDFGGWQLYTRADMAEDVVYEV